MKSIYLFCFCSLVIFKTLMAQDVLTLDEGIKQEKVAISQLNWLSGNWKGKGLGGDCEELWMPVNDNSMQGVFRFYENKKLQFTEYMHLIQEADSTLSIKLKHFNADLSPWEEKEKWITFKLIKVENQTAYFNGMTYQRKKNKLVIKLNMRHNEKKWTEEFVFYKAKL